MRRDQTLSPALLDDPSANPVRLQTGTTRAGDARSGFRPMMWGPDEIAAYLYFGYLPRLPPDWEVLPDWGPERDDDLVTRVHNKLVARGATVFASSFDDLPEGPHLVPLSGGLDSRAILAELCRRAHPGSIAAITVGVPGNLDYELWVEVARAASVTHRRIDISQHQLIDSALVVAARDSDSPTWVFDAYYNRLMRQEYGPEAVYWSGHLGSRLSSTKYLADDPRITFKEALDRFIELNRWSRTARLERPGVDPRGELPSEPTPEDSVVVRVARGLCYASTRDGSGWLEP